MKTGEHALKCEHWGKVMRVRSWVSHTGPVRPLPEFDSLEASCPRCGKMFSLARYEGPRAVTLVRAVIAIAAFPALLALLVTAPLAWAGVLSWTASAVLMAIVVANFVCWVGERVALTLLPPL